MSSITTCKLLNQSNKIGNEEFMVCTEWNYSKIKVLIIRNNNTVLMGEIFVEEFRKYAEIFDKTLNVYLKETEDILSGRKDEVEFFLEDHRFYWKSKEWALGQINVKLVTEFTSLKDFTLLVINHYSQMKNNVFQLEKDNENLKTKNSILLNKLNELISLKEELEKELYKKFILVINTKKAKIRELKRKLEKLENKDSIFDAVTDESDNESDSQNSFTSNSNLIQKPINETLVNEDISKKINAKRQKSETILEHAVNINKKEIELSESDADVIVLKKNVRLTSNLGEDEETPDLLSDESECEVELKFEEENAQDESKRNLSTISHEDSEEEMF